MQAYVTCPGCGNRVEDTYVALVGTCPQCGYNRLRDLPVCQQGPALGRNRVCRSCGFGIAYTPANPNAVCPTCFPVGGQQTGNPYSYHVNWGVGMANPLFANVGDERSESQPDLLWGDRWEDQQADNPITGFLCRGCITQFFGKADKAPHASWCSAGGLP